VGRVYCGRTLHPQPLVAKLNLKHKQWTGRQQKNTRTKSCSLTRFVRRFQLINKTVSVVWFWRINV